MYDYWYAIASIALLPFLSYSRNIVTLKSMLAVTQGHRKWHH